MGADEDQESRLAKHKDDRAAERTPADGVSRPESESTGRHVLRPEFIELFIENQAKEVEIRAGELQQKLRSDEHAHEYALRALDAQTNDRKEERGYRLQKTKWLYIFIGAIVFVMVLLTGCCIAVGKGEIAMEIVKLGAATASGAIGGYGFAKSKRDEKPKDE